MRARGRDGRARRLLDQRGLLLADPVGALARVQLARAYAAAGDLTNARASYESFFELTRDADPWQIYNALLQPRAMLRGRSALESVSATNIDKIIMAVSTTVKESEWPPQQVAFA